MNKRGISLIATVITIIITIILAAAVILTVSDNNPIKNAFMAKDAQNLSTEYEKLNLSIANALSSGLRYIN